MLDAKRIGEYIAQLRKAKGLTQSALADMLCVTHQAVSKWENGAALPDVEVLVAMRQVFGVSVDDILNARQPREQTPAETCTPAAPQQSQSIDTVTGDRIVIYGSRVFESEVTVDQCVIFGGAHFKADLRTDSLEIHGRGEFDKSVQADSFTVGGRARIRGGVTADTLTACGMLSVAGGIACDTLESPGRTDCGGGVTCDSLRNDGSFNLGGGIVTDAMFNSSSLNVGGGVTCDSLENKGTLNAGGGVACDSLVSSGECSLGGGVTADSATLSGLFRFGGGIVASEVEVTLADGECRADSIKAEKLTVRRPQDKSGRLSVREIVIEHGELEHVHADRVKVRTGRIGDGCKIGHMECSPDVEIARVAQVDEVVHTR